MSKYLDLSVIIPYSQAQRFDPAPELFYSYKRMLDSTGLDYEVIFIIDGTRGVFKKEINRIYKLKEEEERIKIIKLAKWFGEGTALSIGFENSHGEKVLTLPPFEQIDVNDIPNLIEALKNCDMAVGNRSQRLGKILNRIQSKIFHYLINFRGDFRFNDLECDVRCFKRKILEKVYIYGEQHHFLPVLVHRFGFKVLEVNVAQSQKDTFQPLPPIVTYLRGYMDLISVFFLVKFTKKPLRFFGISGVFTFFLGALLAIYLFIERIFLGVALANRPLLLLDVLLFIAGIQLFAIGLIGEIIIFAHAKELKDYTIEKIIN
jgi:glycosyltransferase involved in cell wall biosynthesis